MNYAIYTYNNIKMWNYVNFVNYVFFVIWGFLHFYILYMLYIFIFYIFCTYYIFISSIRQTNSFRCPIQICDSIKFDYATNAAWRQRRRRTAASSIGCAAACRSLWIELDHRIGWDRWIELNSICVTRDLHV